MVGEDIENGQVLIKGGKILAVGENLDITSDTEIIDATGCIVTPGLIDGHCHTGMWEEGIGWEGSDGNEVTNPVTPELRAIDAINPMCESFTNALSGGVTTVVTGPGSANVICGTFLAMKTHGKRVDDMVIKNPVAMKVAFGENPKRCYHGKKMAPNTRMAIASILRNTLFKAQNYMTALDNSVLDITKKPTFDFQLEALLPVMRKEIPLKAHAHRADDIFTALRIAKEFDIDITLDHCTEGHLIVDELVKEDKNVFIGPTFGNKSKVELKNKSFETAGILANAGIHVSIITDSPEIPIENLSMCAGMAVKAGLNEAEAWRAITINPAISVNIADRVGSLEPGKDADIVIFNGNPLTDINYTTKYTLVNGRVVYSK